MRSNVRDSFGAKTLPPVANFVLPTRRQVVGVKGAAHEVRREGALDRFGARSGAVARGFMVVRDVAAARSAVTIAATIPVYVSDAAGARGRAQGGVVSRTDVADSFAASSAIAEVRITPKLLRDSAAAKSSVTTKTHVQVGVKDVFAADDAARVFYRAAVRESGGVRGSVISDYASRGAVRDAAGVSASAVGVINTRSIAREKGLISARVTSKAVVSSYARDKMVITDYIYFPRSNKVVGHDTDVWTADMRSWGMSRYVGYPVTDFIPRWIGANSEGLLAPAGWMADSYIETPDVRFSSVSAQEVKADLNTRKRINHVYTYSVHESPLKVTVTADVNGRRVTQVYTQDPRPSDNTRAVRCKVGRGFASNYIKLRIGGEPFDLSHCEVEISNTRRRV